MIPKIKFAAIFAAATILAVYFAVKFLFAVKIEGTLHLRSSKGSATIIREPETLIPHIRGDSWESAVYAQGFLQA